MLTAFVYIDKGIHMNVEGNKWATSGVANSRVWAAGIAEGVTTMGIII